MTGRKKRISVLGSTGSIGRQALDIVAAHPERLQVVGLAAGRNWEALLEQCRRFRPEVAAVATTADAARLKAELGRKTEVVWGKEGLKAVAAWPAADTALVAVSGTVGLEPVLAAVAAGKDIALANKETLVAGGSLVTEAVRLAGVRLLPVDSEHSAIWQCLEGRRRDDIARVILTASGGPFRTLPQKELARVRAAQALRHPTWRMGPKITVDSATLMNKGLEVIEAHWLFEMGYDAIEVVVHPQSIVHGLVALADGTLIACLSATDMRLPIQHALSHPERWHAPVPAVDLASLQELTFEMPDRERFPSLDLAYAAGRTGGTAPAVLNAANEEAVQAFLHDILDLPGIPKVVASVLDEHDVVAQPDLEAVLAADAWARRRAAEIIKEVVKS
ncbi:MAG: 1-deoxy-D-xylulose-5-phosphate reductoisomerase [Bacillota bacterium]|nr:1-deoxy-D-xylulose-5-phosphate reductoisomerase [Bacillota bacterium]